MRVLVVEDESRLGEVFRDLLVDLGHEAVLARSAEEAIGALRRERPDAILLDIVLPGMSGLDFLRSPGVRAAAVPVVAVSGVLPESQERECRRLGAVGFIAKPVTRERLRAVLAALEGEARADGRAARPRRRAARAAVALTVRIIDPEGATFQGLTVDLSAAAVKVRASAALTPGAVVTLAFVPPDGGAALEAVALLVRRDRDGLVFKFVNLPEREGERLDALVRRARPGRATPPRA